jgi:multiple sugar transport system permease protein
MMNRMHRPWVGYLFIAPNMIGVLLFFIIPSLFSIFLVFVDWNFGQSQYRFIGMSNIVRMLQDETFFHSLRITLVYLTSVPLSIIAGFVVALVLNQNVYLKSLLRAMYFMPYITSGIAIAFVWMLLFEPSQGPINIFLQSIGFIDVPGWLSSTKTSMLAIDIIWIWFMLGYNMVIYLSAMQEIPAELLEAAKIDGANAWHTTTRIVLPLVSSTTLLLFITGFIATIKQFGMIQAITQGGPADSTTVLSLLIYKTAFRYNELGYASTLSWALFLIVLVITLIQWFGQKRWVHV